MTSRSKEWEERGVIALTNNELWAAIDSHVDLLRSKGMKVGEAEEYARAIAFHAERIRALARLLEV